MKLKRVTRKEQIFFSAQIKSKSVQGTISGKNVTVLKENLMLAYNIITRGCASGQQVLISFLVYFEWHDTKPVKSGRTITEETTT